MVTTSTTESEYIVISLACQQLLWIQKAFVDLKMPIPCALRCDNRGAIAITENIQVNDRSKHIATHHHKMRVEYRKGTFNLIYVPTDQNLAGICTKTLP